uniref:M23 family metallopeptidase n=1 Tax=candidate division WOR-3 bacterium TaxID=2052148 RepID=A0A7C4GF76_UNCW3
MERLQVLINLKRRNRALNLSVPLHYLYLAAAVLVGFLFFSGFATRLVLRRFSPSGRLTQLVAENSLLRRQLEAYSAAMDTFRQFLAFTEQMDNKLRAAVNLNLIPSDVRLLGIGGSAPTSDAPEVTELLRRVDFNERSLTEIGNTVSLQQARLRSLPSIWPVQGWVTSGFGYRSDPFSGAREMHNGLDIVAPAGTPIVAPADGRVVFAGWKMGYGRAVEIDHGWGIVTFYGHCQDILTRTGALVKRGQAIALVGSSGRSTGTHLHYGVKVNGNWVNPGNYILAR